MREGNDRAFRVYTDGSGNSTTNGSAPSLTGSLGLPSRFACHALPARFSAAHPTSPTAICDIGLHKSALTLDVGDRSVHGLSSGRTKAQHSISFCSVWSHRCLLCNLARNARPVSGRQSSSVHRPYRAIRWSSPIPSCMMCLDRSMFNTLRCTRHLQPTLSLAS